MNKSFQPFFWIAIILTMISAVVTSFFCGDYPDYEFEPWGASGYFHNVVDASGSSVLPVLEDGLAIPENIDSVDELIDFIANNNKSNDSRKKIAAAYIVATMLGGYNPSYGTVNEGHLVDLKYRLNESNIDWYSNVINCINSYYQGFGGGLNPNDDALYSKCRSEPGITITDVDNNVLYQLFRRSGSPVGDYSIGLPPSSKYIPSNDDQDTGYLEPLGIENYCSTSLISAHVGAKMPGFEVAIKGPRYVPMNMAVVAGDMSLFYPETTFSSDAEMCYYF